MPDEDASLSRDGQPERTDLNWSHAPERWFSWDEPGVLHQPGPYLRLLIMFLLVGIVVLLPGKVYPLLLVVSVPCGVAFYGWWLRTRWTPYFRAHRKGS
ncbi:hypothetical protein BH09ACT12_BH09ACT12_19430 [soil metagenome]